jgi:hypothetical protein
METAGDMLNDGTCRYQYDAEGRVKYSSCPWRWQQPMDNAPGQRVGMGGASWLAHLDAVGSIIIKRDQTGSLPQSFCD